MYLVKYRYKDGVVFNGWGGFVYDDDYMFGLVEQLEPDYVLLTPDIVDVEKFKQLSIAYYQSYRKEIVLNGDGSVTIREPSLEFLKFLKLNELKQLAYSVLSTTDWVVIKLLSLSFEGVDQTIISAELSKYQKILEKRAAIRDRIQQLEVAIESAVSEEELNEIKLTL